MATVVNRSQSLNPANEASFSLISIFPVLSHSGLLFTTNSSQLFPTILHMQLHVLYLSLKDKTTKQTKKNERSYLQLLSVGKDRIIFCQWRLTVHIDHTPGQALCTRVLGQHKNPQGIAASEIKPRNPKREGKTGGNQVQA